MLTGVAEKMNARELPAIEGRPGLPLQAVTRSWHPAPLAAFRRSEPDSGQLVSAPATEPAALADLTQPSPPVANDTAALPSAIGVDSAMQEG